MRLGVIFFALLVTGCQEQREQPFQLIVRVTDDTNAPMAGIPVLMGKTRLGVTDAAGTLERKLDSPEGSTVLLSVESPKLYKPVTPAKVVLRRLAGLSGQGSVPIEQTLVLEPREHKYAILLKTGIPNLPVRAFGKQTAITDESGAAMFLHQGEPGEELKIEIDTTRRKELQPQNPTTTVVLPPRSDAQLVEQKFHVPPPAPVHVHRKAGPTLPKRL
jgi:hypothetical protein